MPSTFVSSYPFLFILTIFSIIGHDVHDRCLQLGRNGHARNSVCHSRAQCTQYSYDGNISKLIDIAPYIGSMLWSLICSVYLPRGPIDKLCTSLSLSLSKQTNNQKTNKQTNKKQKQKEKQKTNKLAILPGIINLRLIEIVFFVKRLTKGQGNCLLQFLAMVFLFPYMSKTYKHPQS